MIILYLLGIIFVVCVVILIFMAINGTRVRKSLNKVDEHIYYDNDDKTLYVGKRFPELYNLIKISEHFGTYNGYKEEKLVYKSVTIGGATTGNIHKTGGGYTEKRIVNGRYDLHYKPATYAPGYDVYVGPRIYKIYLSEELLEEAKTSSIAEYIVDNYISVVDSYDKISESAFNSLQSGNDMLARYTLNQLEDDNAAKHPTRRKCEDILYWLCTP